MASINPHTTRGTGTVLTAAIYNADHQNHITNANSLNAEVIAATTSLLRFPTVSTDNRLIRFDGAGGATQSTGILADDSNNLSGIGTISSGAITSSAGITATTSVNGATGSFSGLVTVGSFSCTGAASMGSGSSVGIFTVGTTLTVNGVSNLNNNVTVTGLIATNNGNASAPAYRFASDADTGIYYTVTPALAFSVAGVEQGRWQNDGLHFQTTAYSMGDAAVGLSLYNGDPIINVGRANNAALQVKRRTTDGAAVNFYRQEVNVGTISVTAAATAYNTSSDENLKVFIGVYDPDKAIDIIRRDPVRDFTWKNSGEYAIGWGAQTSYKVSKDLASPGKGKPGNKNYQPWGVDQGKRTPYLWAAMSKVLDRLDAIEKRIN